MGLLDWKPLQDDDEAMFPNFDVSLSRTTSNEDPPSNSSVRSFSSTSSDVSTLSHFSEPTRPAAVITAVRADARFASPPPPSQRRSSLPAPAAVTSTEPMPPPQQKRPRPKPHRATTTPAKTPSRPPRPVRPSLRGRRPSSFDLFGDDSELQEAESRISFCDICLKQCDVH